MSYDMTFVVMMLTSLYEPETREGTTRCIVHPFQKHATRVNDITDYAAHMNVLLSYYKCKDDWQDDRKIKQLVVGKLLSRKSKFSRNFYREKWKTVGKLLKELTEEKTRTIWIWTRCPGPLERSWQRSWLTSRICGKNSLDSSDSTLGNSSI